MTAATLKPEITYFYCPNCFASHETLASKEAFICQNCKESVRVPVVSMRRYYKFASLSSLLRERILCRLEGDPDFDQFSLPLAPGPLLAFSLKMGGLAYAICLLKACFDFMGPWGLIVALLLNWMTRKFYVVVVDNFGDDLRVLVTRLFGIRRAAILTPFYFIVIRGRRVIYLPVGTLVIDSVKPVKEYTEHGIEVNSLELSIATLSGYIELEALAVPNLRAEHERVIRATRLKGMLQQQNDLALDMKH